MKYFTYLFWVGLAVSMSCSNHSATSIPEGHRTEKPPYQLITMSENCNVLSASPALYDAHLQHSDGQIFPLTGVICVDGQTYRFMGGDERPDVAIAGMSYDEAWAGRYTFVRPSGGWLSADFDDAGWELGKAPFGTLRYHSQTYSKMNTVWPTSAIWVRRKININDRDLSGKKLYLKYSHDDEFEFYVNGTPIVPLFNGQVSAALSPVEATSHLLLLLAMLTAAEGNPEYAQEHWPLICRWSHFLQQNRRDTNRDAVNRGITTYSYMKEQILRASE